MKRFAGTGTAAHGQIRYRSPEELGVSQSFDYLADDGVTRLPDGTPSDRATVIAALDALGEAMITEAEGDTSTGDANLPPVYTYWGQFIDHDITLNTDRDHSGSPFRISDDDFSPVPPDMVRTRLANARSEQLDLDSVYGGGPLEDAELFCPGDSDFLCCDDGAGRLRVGRNVGSAGTVPPPDPADLCRDLPRDAETRNGKAIIGDARNDENLIVAQFHLAFLRFHNRALEALGEFEPAQRQMRLHYQWLVLNDYLKTIADASIVEAIVRDGDLRLGFAGQFMPVEFAAAAFRFGHTMVRAAYDYNENFGRGEVLLPTATFDQIFRFTGNSRNPSEPALGGNDRLPANWIADWVRLTHRGGRFRDGRPERLSRKIDTHLAEPLGVMRNEGSEEPTAALRILMRHLARRNLRRGYLLSAPTGQAMAQLCRETTLSRSELLRGVGDSRPALEEALRRDGELLLTHTPLWFYVLREAEVFGNGEHLGPVGTRIVTETIVGLLKASPSSILADDWDPSRSELPGGEQIRSIDDFLRFAGVM